MSGPFDSFQQGLMTGSALGGRIRERANARQVGGLMASGDLSGARNAAYQQGDLRTGQALDGQVSQQAQAQRGQQMTGALAQGNYDEALSFAESPEELQQITEFRNTASEAERAAAVQRSEQMAMAVGSIMTLPPEQQFQAAQQAAAGMGLDPNSITPDMVTPQALERMRMQALGLKDYLLAQDRQADNRRQETVAEAQIAAARALADQRRVSAGVAQSREARQGRASGGGSRSSGGSRPSAPAAPARKPWERY